MLCTLTLLVYLADLPSFQRRERYAGLPQIACAIHAQQVAAEWVAEHPGWRVSGWRCRR